MQRTKLEWDNYIYYLIDAINGSKFMKRAENKPMSTPKMPSESHISTRSMHLRESADIIKRLAKGLGLNENFAYAGMLMHDAGHPFSAHEGEEIFTQLGEVYDTQYFHHNAKGVEIVLSEDICGKAISKIPGIEQNPKLREKLEDEFYYFLDIIISHDGEATQKEVEGKKEDAKENENKSIKDIVFEKSRKANSLNKYKFTAQTPEGKLAKYADVIAYLSSDMQDAFRLGIMKDFNEGYLALIGEIYSKDYSAPQEQKIEYGKKVIQEVKKRNLRETRDSIKKEKDGEILKAITNILTEIKKNNLDFFTSEIDELETIVEQEKNKFSKRRISDFCKKHGVELSNEQIQELENRIIAKTEKGETLTKKEEAFSEYLNTVYSQTNKIEEYAAKMLRVRSNVVYEITNYMKEFFINDIIETTKSEEKEKGEKTEVTPHMSAEVSNLFFKESKSLNYEHFVQHTNFEYQTTDYPKAADNLVSKAADSLVKSGAIRNKFYDESVREYIKDSDALRYMKTKYRKEKDYVSYRRKHGIGTLKAKARPTKDKFTGSQEDYELMKFYADVYGYVENEDQVFAIRYENTFNAIKHRINEKIELALNPKSKIKNKMYKEKIKNQVEEIRQEVLAKYGTTELTKEQLNEYKKLKIEQGLNDIEKKMAVQLASDYLAGMTDRSFVDLATKTGYLPKDLTQKGVRGKIKSENVVKLITEHNEDKEKQGDER